MIVTVAKNSQLKRPLRSISRKDIVLVLPSGKVLRPLTVKNLNSLCKDYLIAFDIPVENIIQDRTNFSGVEKEIKDKFPARLFNRIMEMLALSQSLSIIHVEKHLLLERAEARQLIELLVKWGVYIKYYHYWRRTPAFSVWIKKRVEG